MLNPSPAPTLLPNLFCQSTSLTDGLSVPPLVFFSSDLGVPGQDAALSREGSKAEVLDTDGDDGRSTSPSSSSSAQGKPATLCAPGPTMAVARAAVASLLLLVRTQSADKDWCIFFLPSPFLFALDLVHDASLVDTKKDDTFAREGDAAVEAAKDDDDAGTNGGGALLPPLSSQEPANGE